MLDTAVKLKALQERFKSKTESEYIKTLEMALQNVLGKLALDNNTIETKRLKSVRNAIEKEIDEIYKKIDKTIKEDTLDFTELAYKTNTALLGVGFVGVPDKLAKKILDLDRIILMGDRAFSISELLGNARANQIKRVKQIMSAGIIANDGYKNITKKLKESIPKSAHEIRTIVNTSIAYATDEASQELENEHIDLIDKWRSVATLDSRTTFLCASLDGKEYPKSKYPNRESIPNRPPRHFNCRSVLVPITKDWTPTTRPAKGDKKELVSSEMNFKEWFKRQSSAFQEGYLGKARYKLYKEDRLKIESFVDVKSGKRLKIDEIKKLVDRDLPKVKKPKMPKIKANTNNKINIPLRDFDTITKKDKEIVNAWTSNEHYKAMQESLKGNKEFKTRLGMQEISHRQHDMAKGFVKIFDKYQGNVKNRKIYRGIGISQDEYFSKYKKLKKGDIISVNQDSRLPSSFTIKEQTAEGFASAGDVKLVFEVEIKKYNAFYINKFSQFKDEHEVLIGKDKRFKFVRIENGLPNPKVILEEIDE